MSATWPKIQRFPRLRNTSYRRVQVRCVADLRPFAAGDLVLLRQKLDRGAPPILTKPLKPGGQINGHKGIISHDEIIGKRVRDLVKTAPLRSGKDGTEYRLHEVKLQEYVRLSRRLVTPIYPADAALIVELFDLHANPFHLNDHADQSAPKLEILEAGTGHGALTLYLSRAIHGSNPPAPEFDGAEDETSRANAIEAWKRRRRAIIHTIEHSAKYSQHAEQTVKGFKHGIYHSNIDFHVTDVGAWTRKALNDRDEKPFLSHAFLDLPHAETHLEVLAKALRTNGCLIVFKPSITQILECVSAIKGAGILLELENVIELGVNGGSGGREWNVKAVKTKSSNQHVPLQDSGYRDEAEVTGHEGSESETKTDFDNHMEESSPSTSERWSMVCRPKVGERIVGGGFLGIWRKQRDMK